MAVITDPDTLSRFDVIFGTSSQQVSIYPIGDTQRVSADATFTSTFASDLITPAGGSVDTKWDTGDIVYVTTVGTLPVGYVAGTEYYVGSLTTTTAKLYASFDAAVAGTTPVALSGDGSGTHTVHTSTIVNAYAESMDGSTLTSGWISLVAGETYVKTGVVVGDVVSVQNSAGAGHYYVTNVDTTKLIVTDIDLGTSGAVSAGLTVADTTFNANTAVDTSTNVITMVGHGYNDGDEVVYDGSVGTDIGGLATGGVYYVIRNAIGSIKLALTYANAIAATPVPISLTSKPASQVHTLHDRLLISMYTNGANTSESINGNTTSGDGLGDIADGVTMQAIYSYSKEEWKDDSIAADEYIPSDNISNEGNLATEQYVNDLIRFEFPIEAITSEQFEIGGGASHDAWTWFNDYSRKKVRTGGWADKNVVNTADLERYTGIITLGNVDSDTQVYYQQLHVVNTPVDFTFLGVVNEPIRIWLDTDQNGTADTNEDKTTFLKLFARKKARTYAGSQISDIGVSTIQTIVNRFPLAHATDAAIVETDGAILGKAPWKNVYKLATSATGSINATPTADNIFTDANAFFTDLHIVTIDIVAGGTGYAVGDTFEPTPGTATETIAPVITVATLSGSAISTVTITNPGAWSATGTMSFQANVALNLSGSGSGATFDFRVDTIQPGDTVTISATTNTRTALINSWTVGSITSDTTLTIADDADFTTDWSSVTALDETGITYTVDSYILAADKSSQTNAAQDYTANTGIKNTGTTAVGTITDTTAGNNNSLPFLGVQQGDMVKITDSKEVLIDHTITGGGTGYVLDELITAVGANWTTVPRLRVKGVTGGVITKTIIERIGVESATGPTITSWSAPTGTGATFDSTVSGQYNGIFKVLDSSTTGASNPTDTVLYLDTTDVEGDFPTTTEAAIGYQVFEPSMWLQWKQFDIDTTTPTSYDFNKGTGTNLDTIDNNGGTWDTTSMGAGTILTVTNATQTSNNGIYTVKSNTTGIVTLLSTTANEATDRLGITDTVDTAAIVTLFNGFNRTIGTDIQGNAAVFGFNWKLSGNDATLTQHFEKVQHQMRQSTDIDNTGANKRGDITDLLMSFATPTGTGLNLFIDDLASGDINNATFNDATGTGRNFPFTSSGNLAFNKNLTDDASSKYWLFFANDDAGENIGRDHGTKDAIIVNDASSPIVAIQGDVNGSGNHTGTARTADSAGTILIPFTYDYDGNDQRGTASKSVDAPVTLVAIGLTLAQYVVSTGTITEATGITISATAALERNYSNA